MMNSVEEVIQKMKDTLEIFNIDDSLNHFIPFLTAYLYVTEQVYLHSKDDENYYSDYPAIERLDITFAELYFKPLDMFLNKKQVSKQWHTYYEYCIKGKDYPIVQLIMGINVHINADLTIALIESNYTNKEDFDKVNDILLEVIPKLMHYLLIEEHDVTGLVGILFRRFMIYEFNRIIVQWRENAWENKLKLENGELSKEELVKSVDDYSKKLMLWFSDMYNPFGVFGLIRRLNDKRLFP